ncbi:MAG: 3-oxoacyl-[acyl-carrier-protein] synthase III C-terminal domain-containing protein [Phycisphaerales bacterium]
MQRDFPALRSTTSGSWRVQMAGQPVFKFAVSKFPEVIEETLEKSGLRAADVDHYVCHQANMRILESARTRFGLDAEA